MPSSEMSNNSSFYQLACHTTDMFTSCIRIYEDLLAYFEAETTVDAINERLLNIGGMLTKLYTELTTLKNEMTTSTVVGDDKVSEPSAESNSVTQVVCEQENTTGEASTVEHKGSNKENALNELPKRSWEDVNKGSNKENALDELPKRFWKDVSQVQAEEGQRGKVNHEDQTISRDEKVHRKPTEYLTQQSSGFVYKCGNCHEAITLYNEDLDLSIALHNQDGCCRGKPSKLIAVQKEKQEEKLNTSSAKGQVQNSTNFQEDTKKLNSIPAQKNKVGATRYSCIQPSGNAFKCTVCNKKLTGHKNFDEHLGGFYHQNSLKEIQEKTEKNVTYSRSAKSSENKSPNSVHQKESVSALDDQLFSIITHLSRSLPTQMQYLSVVKGVIVCNLCVCPIPPTVTNVRDHVLGSRHSKNQKELPSADKNCVTNNK